MRIVPFWKYEGKIPWCRLEDNIKVDLKKKDEIQWLGLWGSEEGQVAGLYEHGNQPPGFIRHGECLD